MSTDKFINHRITKKQFESEFPEWTRNIKSNKHDPDYIYKGEKSLAFCEIKSSLFYNKDEYQYHTKIAQSFPFYIFLIWRMYRWQDFTIETEYETYYKLKVINP
jgi:hypothetical protein